MKRYKEMSEAAGTTAANRWRLLVEVLRRWAE